MATVVALLGIASSSALAAARTDCQPQAIRDLERLSPAGHAVYLAMRDKKQFLTFLTCEDVQLGLSTAVHESVHILTEQLNAYPLIGGGSVPRQHMVSRFYPPREIAYKFNQHDNYVQTYLRRGAASSADDLMYLLDELNAYSHDLASATKLVDLHKRDGQVDHRAGLAALMAFLMQYVDVARERKTPTWEGLQRAEVKSLIAPRRLADECLGVRRHRHRGITRKRCRQVAPEAIEQSLVTPRVSNQAGSASRLGTALLGRDRQPPR